MLIHWNIEHVAVNPGLHSFNGPACFLLPPSKQFRQCDIVHLFVNNPFPAYLPGQPTMLFNSEDK